MDVELFEVGLREGLQSEKLILTSENKKDLVSLLCQAGVKHIQLGSFVNPKLLPQLADTDRLCQMLQPPDSCHFSGLVLNAKGLDRAIASGIKQVDLSLSVSNTHSLKNTRMSRETALHSMLNLIKKAKKNHLKVRVGLQCVFGCMDEGTIPQSQIFSMINDLLAQGVDWLSLADSTGMANPRSIDSICATTLDLCGNTPLILHLHDTMGLGMVNLYHAVQLGIRHFDTSFGGLGGCPYIQNAAGNIATEDAVFFLEKIGHRTGINPSRLCEITKKLALQLNHELPGRIHKLTHPAHINVFQGDSVATTQFN